MKLSRHELIKKLSVANSLYSQNSPNERYRTLFFGGGAISCENAECFISQEVEWATESFSVDTRDILNVAKKIGGDEVSLEVSGSTLIVSSGSAKAKVRLSDHDPSDRSIEGEVKSEEIISSVFCGALDVVSGATKKEQNIENEQVTLLETGDGELSVVSADSRSLAIYPVGTVGIELFAMLPNVSCRTLSKIASECETVTVYECFSEGSSFSVQCGDTFVQCRTISSNFPPWRKFEQLRPSSHPVFFKVDSSELAAAIDLASLFTSEERKAVELSVDGNSLRIGNVSTVKGGSESFVDISEARVDSGVDPVAMVSPSAVSKFIKMHPGETLSVGMCLENKTMIESSQCRMLVAQIVT